LLPHSGMSQDWWAETDDAILQCLRDGGAMSPSDIARRLGISSREATAVVCMLATQGKIRLGWVELGPGAALAGSARDGARREESGVLAA
jgi:hypothetical protein